VAAGLLGIFLGGLGVHRFYLGYNGIGGAILGLQIVGWLTVWVCGIGLVPMAAAGIWGLVEGIMILAGAINKDASGAPLQ
jgi:TM2 domain-containing membrane protein YozV